ncbi:MAG: 16S rRNA (cytidine(1402)-2'-O)-methyltransferase, partial [Mariprofundus sp.]
SAMLDSLLKRLRSGQDIALISDAGTPLISDPGYRLVRGLRAERIRITPIPGASSLLAALCAAGLPTDHFRFSGFLPRSGKSRQTEISRIAASDETVVLLESPRRLLATLHDFHNALQPDRQIVVARELTKIHEEFKLGPASVLISHFEQQHPRGEIVLLIEPTTEESVVLTEQQIINCLHSEAMLTLPPSARAKAVAKTLDIERARVYALMTRSS